MESAVIGNNEICLFCCKTNENEDNSDAENSSVYLFVELLQRFTNCYELNGLSLRYNNNEEQSNSSKLFCCKLCLPMVNNFCTDYHNLKCLELKLEFGLECLVNKMKLVEEVASNFVKLETPEANIEPSDISNGSEVCENLSSRNSLSCFSSYREKIIKLCNQRLSKSQPRLHLKRVMYRKKGEKFNCSKCDVKYHSEYKMKCHLIKQHKTWRCFKCNRDFVMKHKLLKHNHKNHPDSIRAPGVSYETIQGKEAPLICRLCNRPFAHRLSLRRHLHMKHKDLRDEFIDLINESTLIVKERFEYPGKNKEPQEIFTSEATIEKTSEEIVNTSTFIMTNVDPKGPEIKVSSGIILTPNVDFVVVKEDIDTTVLDDTEQQSLNNFVDELKIFQCTECLKYFPTNLKFQPPPNHSPHVNSLCSDCGEQFETQSQAETLTLTLQDVQVHNCSTCSQKFLTKHALNSHIAYNHNSPTSCPICAKTFPSKRNMVSHKRMVHSKREFPCVKCGKIFKAAKLLKLHEIRHLGQEGKNAQCIECGKAFYTSGELKDHALRIHGNGEQKEKTCKICKKTYKNYLSLNDHMKSHRKDKKDKKRLESGTIRACTL